MVFVTFGCFSTNAFTAKSFSKRLSNDVVSSPKVQQIDSSAKDETGIAIKIANKTEIKSMVFIFTQFVDPVTYYQSDSCQSDNLNSISVKYA